MNLVKLESDVDAAPETRPLPLKPLRRKFGPHQMSNGQLGSGADPQSAAVGFVRRLNFAVHLAGANRNAEKSGQQAKSCSIVRYHVFELWCIVMGPAQHRGQSIGLSWPHWNGWSGGDSSFNTDATTLFSSHFLSVATPILRKRSTDSLGPKSSNS